VSPTTSFRKRVAQTDRSALRAESVSTLMVNVGLRCDLACPHCHHACSPERTEQMPEAVMDRVLALVEELRPELADITGGAPELHPLILEFATALRESDVDVRLRTNLVSMAKRPDLAAALARLGVGLLASVPLPRETAATGLVPPGSGVATCWERCVDMLGDLAELGFGGEDAALDLACTIASGPTAAESADVERGLRETLAGHGIAFGRLVLITCVPVGRFAARLGPDGTGEYVDGLAGDFEPATVPHLACRHGLEVAWDGTLWDCDFNLAAGIAPPPGFRTIDEVAPAELTSRPISFGTHCFACSARSGSS
jgi:radical SAM/Cys-rich protein